MKYHVFSATGQLDKVLSHVARSQRIPARAAYAKVPGGSQMKYGVISATGQLDVMK